MSNRMEFWRGNIIKYASRAGMKLSEGKTAVESEISDLRKAVHYCEFRLEELEKGEPYEGMPTDQ